MNHVVRRVACAVSGGVDSAVAALILKNQGYDVIGLFMRNWDIRNETGHCSADADREDAELTCHKLKIPFHEVNFVKEYWHDVFSYTLREYEEGRTPNPDIFCNKYIKFNTFLNYALETFDAQAIATGHYAKSSAGQFLQKLDLTKGVKLLKAMDTVKDQTFFLSQISQDALEKTMFPIGDLTKAAVKQIAMSSGLEKMAKRKESMGMCFIGSRKFHRFIEDYIAPKSGRFIDVETGHIVGEHKGTHFWTLGQRALIGGMLKAYYIARIDATTQDILVALGQGHPALYCQSIYTEPAHWIHHTPAELDPSYSQCDKRNRQSGVNHSRNSKSVLQGSERNHYVSNNNVTTQGVTHRGSTCETCSNLSNNICECQWKGFTSTNSLPNIAPGYSIDSNSEMLGPVFHADFRFQHTHPLVSCSVQLTDNNELLVHTSQPMRAMTPGQFAVFYHGEECLGSARILRQGQSMFDLNVTEKLYSNEFS